MVISVNGRLILITINNFSLGFRFEVRQAHFQEPNNLQLRNVQNIEHWQGLIPFLLLTLAQAITVGKELEIYHGFCVLSGLYKSSGQPNSFDCDRNAGLSGDRLFA